MKKTNELPEKKRFNKRSRLWTFSGNIFYKFLLWADYFNHRYIQSNFFTFNGDVYNNFVNMYNTTWKCERTIEIPIVWRLVCEWRNGKVLEVGNVLSHYVNFKHDIIDKYEKGVGVINIDVLDFKPSKKYDLIIAISTLEHVGWDETPKEPEKVLRCIDHLKSLLSSGGLFVFSIPAGYNSYIDEVIRKSIITDAQFFHLMRISIDKWVQAAFKDIDDIQYGGPWGAANGLTIIFVKNL